MTIYSKHILRNNHLHSVEVHTKEETDGSTRSIVLVISKTQTTGFVYPQWYLPFIDYIGFYDEGDLWVLHSIHLQCKKKCKISLRTTKPFQAFHGVVDLLNNTTISNKTTVSQLKYLFHSSSGDSFSHTQCLFQMIGLSVDRTVQLNKDVCMVITCLNNRRIKIGVEICKTSGDVNISRCSTWGHMCSFFIFLFPDEYKRHGFYFVPSTFLKEIHTFPTRSHPGKALLTIPRDLNILRTEIAKYHIPFLSHDIKKNMANTLNDASHL